MPEAKTTPSDPHLAELVAQLQAHGAFMESLCAQAGNARWDCLMPRFVLHLARSVSSRFKSHTPSWAEVEAYLGTLHLEDFALACGCADGAEAAWEFFVRGYRGYLRQCAGAMLRRAAESPEARELADSLFAELYGLADSRRGSNSLFRYFHGRSSLKTWLRAVLAQRHVDGIRAARRFDSLDEEQDGDGRLLTSEGASSLDQHQKNSSASSMGPASGPLALPPDPYREKYIALFCAALRSALEGLAPEDHRRVCLYYAEGKTLAEIGRLRGEHESSVSRNLERIRRELRATVEGYLRQGTTAKSHGQGDGVGAQGLSEAQIAACFQYATEDAPIDFNLLFPSEAEAGGSDVAQQRSRPPNSGRLVP